MLLRRVIEHVKTQNWFAVALDFAIVVVGILLAFQITEWSQERAEQLRSREYLSRIHADLMVDHAALRSHREFWGQVAEHGHVAIRYAETGNVEGLTEWEILRSFLDASQFWPLSFVDSTYSELRSAGELRLIPEQGLRSALAEYYVLVAARRAGPGHYQLLPDYRKWVRGRMRSDILRYYWQACFDQEAGVQMFIQCPPPDGISGLSDVLGDLVADREIIDALRYWVDTQTMAVELAGFDLARAQLLIDEIKALQ